MFTKKTYKVALKGRTGVIYSEGKKRIFIESELLGTELGIVIYSGSIKNWEKPYGKEIVSKEDRLKIIQNIKMEFERLGYKVDVF